jgi:hypothetical protein
LLKHLREALSEAEWWSNAKRNRRQRCLAQELRRVFN